MESIKPPRKPRIGLYSIGHPQYWHQFDGLRERLIGYGRFIEDRIAVWAEVRNVGMVCTAEEARQAGTWFCEQGVDIIFCHTATYAMSASHLPIAQICQRPIVVLNLQPAERMDYERTATGEWLAQCVACTVPEIANAFERSGIEFHVVSGLLGLKESPPMAVANEATCDHPQAISAWREIEQWTRAAGVVRTLRHGRMGFLGHTYPGMLDMYSDFTMIQAQTGMVVEVLEMCELAQLIDSVTAQEKKAKLEQVHGMFIISEDSPSDPLAQKPQPEQLDWACTVAVAQEKLVRQFDIDALTYYYRGSEGNEYERIQAGFILGHSLLTSRGIPCSGEGDMKTAVAMKICDTLGIGGSFSEIVASDFVDGTILLGHDGPFHIDIAETKPILRGMGLYHGKSGSGVSVEATVRRGPVTVLNVTQTGDGRLKAIVNHGEATDGPTLRIGNTMTPVQFAQPPSQFMNAWFALAPTHHCALAVGHHADVLKKVITLLDWPLQSVCL